MPKLIVSSFDGTERPIEGDVGLTLMETIRDHDFEDLLALCGGCLSCATCHVHVDPAFADKLEPMSEMEDGLLTGAAYRTDFSRLSCQIQVTPALEGMKVTVVPEN